MDKVRKSGFLWRPAPSFVQGAPGVLELLWGAAHSRHHPTFPSDLGHVKRSYIEEFLDMFMERYHSVEEYLLTIGLSEKQILSLKERGTNTFFKYLTAYFIIIFFLFKFSVHKF